MKGIGEVQPDSERVNRVNHQIGVLNQDGLESQEAVEGIANQGG